jgi:hypothetical protein
MALTLNLPSEIAQYLLQEASQKGLSVASVTLGTPDIIIVTTNG